MREEFKMLRYLLSEAVRRQAYDGLLFSGGLDTSVIAALNPKVLAVTISLKGVAEDIYYSNLLAKRFGLKHVHYAVDVDEALLAIPHVIGILRSFDPAIPNDLVVYFGIKKAKELGITAIATGDGSDELFGGYSFMKDLDDLEGYIQRISKNMRFSSNTIGKYFGIRIIQPFMDRAIVDYALQIPVALKIRKENGQTFGKWILRKAFEDVLPKEITWQNKRPLEYGSGMRRLRKIISDKVSDEEFRENRLPIKFINKEHFYYYKIYRQVVGEIPKPKRGQKSCPGCGAGMDKKDLHCKVCGYTLDWRPN